MSNDCASFRTALEAELLGRPSRGKLVWLSWNGHLLACGDCRELLAREEALEDLLASLPEPRLPAATVRRVLRRLREERTRETRLDTLLDLEGEVRAPDRLAHDVLAGLAAKRRLGRATSAGDCLDALLELDPGIHAPPGLAGRILAGLEKARSAPVASPIRRQVWLVAAAAGLLLAFLGWTLASRGTATGGREPEPVVRRSPQPDPDLLAALDVLEEWDLLMQDDLDVLLSTLEPADLALLDYR